MPKQEKIKKDGSMIGQFQDDVIERSKDIWLAGLGAFATVEEEGSKLFNNLVEKGKEREDKGKKQLDKVYKEVEEGRKDIREEVSERVEKAMKTLEEKFEGVLDRMGIPTSKEVHDLIEKVDKLSDRVATLSKKMEVAEDKPKTPPKTPK